MDSPSRESPFPLLGNIALVLSLSVLGVVGLAMALAGVRAGLHRLTGYF